MRGVFFAAIKIDVAEALIEQVAVTLVLRVAQADRDLEVVGERVGCLPVDCAGFGSLAVNEVDKAVGVRISARGGEGQGQALGALADRAGAKVVTEAGGGKSARQRASQQELDWQGKGLRVVLVNVLLVVIEADGVLQAVIHGVADELQLVCFQFDPALIDSCGKALCGYGLPAAIEQVACGVGAAIQIRGVIAGLCIPVGVDVFDHERFQFPGHGQVVAVHFQILVADTFQSIVLTALGGVTHGSGHLLVEFAAQGGVGERRVGKAVVNAVLDLGDLEWRGYAAVVGAVKAVVDYQVFRGLKAQRYPIGRIILAGQVALALVSRPVIGSPAIVLHLCRRELHRHHVSHYFWQVYRAGQAVIAVVANAGLQFAPQLTAGFDGGDVDCPAAAVATEQGALGAAQYFNRLQVSDIENRAYRLAHVDTVQVETGLRVHHQRGFTAAHAADINRHIGV